MGKSEAKKSREAMILGLAVFFLGIGLLCFTFYMAYSAFVNPVVVSQFADLVPSMDGIMGSILGLVVYVIPVFLLFVMGSVGGRIAKHGFNMYKARLIQTSTQES